MNRLSVPSILLATLAGLSVASAAPANAAPPQATAAAPGDIVSARQIWAPGFESSKVWHITYRSTTTHGTSNTVSGTVIVPDGSTTKTPIIGYGPGTHGLGDQCAPSVGLQWGTENEGGLIHQYVGKGFAVAITDYEGLGTPGDHTYSVGRAQANAVFDVVRAAQRLSGTGLGAKAPVAIVGYSQGGQTAGWAAETAPSYAPELNIKAFSAGAPPANLRSTARYNDGDGEMGLVLAAAVGMNTAYPELNLANDLTEAGKAAVADIRDDCTSDFGKYGGKPLDYYANPGLIDRPDWAGRLDQQNLGTRGPKAPVLLYHSNGDEIIPAADTATLKTAWCTKGSNVTFWRTDTGAHANTAAYLSPLVTQWVADRLAGRATSGNC